MTYTVARLEETSIVVAVLTGQVDKHTLANVLRHCAGTLQTIRESRGLIINFLPADELHLGNAKNTAAHIARWLPAQEKLFPTVYAIVSSHHKVAAIAQHLADYGFSIPILSDIDTAQTYVNLKIGGIYLRQSLDGTQTVALQDDTPPVDKRTVFQRTERPETNTTTPLGGILCLQTVSAGKTMLVPLQKTLTLGRRDTGDCRPDIDLSLWGGYSNGISRQHAQLVVGTDSRLYLCDLSSTNGTYLNEHRLVANRGYVVHHGDTIRMGNLSLRIYFAE